MGFYNRYANLKIARPEDGEFPKWMDHEGKSYLVHSENEVAELVNPLAPQESNPVGFGEDMISKEHYKSSLLQQALDLGIPARKTWGIAKLQKAIHDYAE